MVVRPGVLVAGVATALVLSGTAVALPPGDLAFPARSPRASVSQWVGVTNITVAYDSQAVGGRKLWGGLIRPDALWLIGAVEAPAISFSKDVLLAAVTVPAGTYSLLAIPSTGDWTIILNRGVHISRPADRDPALDAALVKVRAEPAPRRERVTFLFSDFTDTRATLDLEWETLRVRIPIEAQTETQISNELRWLDGAWRHYAEAARFFLEKRTDFASGLRYADQSIALRENSYNRWLKASLLAAQGDYLHAREEAERALVLGRAAGDEFKVDRQIEQALPVWRQRVDASGGQPKSPRLKEASPEVHVAATQPELTKSAGAGAPQQESDVESTIERPAPVNSAKATKTARAPSQKEFGVVVARGLPELRRCYQRALRQDPGLSTGRLTLSIAVDASGRVTSVNVAPALRSEALDQCLKTAVGRWGFPAAPADYETQVPLVLSGRT